MENKGYAKFGGGGGSNKVHYSGKCGSGVYVKCIDREGWGNAV